MSTMRSLAALCLSSKERQERTVLLPEELECPEVSDNEDIPQETSLVSQRRRQAFIAGGSLFALALVVVFLGPHWQDVTQAQQKAAMQLQLVSNETADPCKLTAPGLLGFGDADCDPPSLNSGASDIEEAVESHHSEKASNGFSPQGPATAGDCGLVDEETDYEMDGESWFDHMDNVGSKGDCCDLCRNHEPCTAWTWFKDAGLPGNPPGQCWMKSGKVSKKKSQAGVISGLRGEEKTHESEGEKEENKHEHECASEGASCLKSKCCKDPGHQCFTKNDFWAQCMVDCVPGPDPLDQVSPMPWACKALGKRSPGKPKECSGEGEDCSTSKCCKAGGTQCFQKNETFAQCKADCTPGPDMHADDWKPWSCKKLGPWTMGAAPWVATKCAAAGADCSQAQCCAEAGMQCYRQSPYYAQCKPSCKKGEKPNPWDQPWDCTPVGTRTPELGSGAGQEKGKVAPWVETHCVGEGTNCMDAQCCHGVNAQCYAKNKYYGTCKASCSTDPDPNDDNKTWTCDKLGPRSFGLALKGWPSVYCFSLYMPSRYEGPLMKEQLKRGAGIFSCDGYDVLSQEEDVLGEDEEGNKIKPLSIAMIRVGVSQDGTAGNAKLFMAVWDKIIAHGRFRNFDWTIKVDPDAVIIPWRVRTHMTPHTGENVYVVNCNKFPGSPNFPMMYGAVEIFSNLAMDAYARGSWKCGTQLPWNAWGEDYYMTHCLDFLGVGRISDFGTLGDNLCTGANCADTYTASFHPFKSIDVWMQCWGQAIAPR